MFGVRVCAAIVDIYLWPFQIPTNFISYTVRGIGFPFIFSCKTPVVQRSPRATPIIFNANVSFVLLGGHRCATKCHLLTISIQSNKIKTFDLLLLIFGTRCWSPPFSVSHARVIVWPDAWCSSCNAAGMGKVDANTCRGSKEHRTKCGLCLWTDVKSFKL